MPSHSQRSSDDGEAGAAGSDGTGVAAGFGAQGGAEDTNAVTMACIFGPGIWGTAVQNVLTPGEEDELASGSQNQQIRQALFNLDMPMQPRWAGAAQRAPGGQYGPDTDDEELAFMQGITAAGDNNAG
jgi:hypothetical protein